MTPSNGANFTRGSVPLSLMGHGTNPLSREALHARWRAGQVAEVIS
jgi:hypothetical protein